MSNEQARLKIIYRSNSHAPLWVVAEKAGIWEKNGLEVDTSPLLVREKAVEALRSGHVDLISGNHHNLYARRAKNGEDFVHLAQAANNWTDNRMVVADGIQDVRELRGRKIVVDKITGHAGLNVWLFLRQEGLDAERGDVELVSRAGSAEERWKAVLKGEFAATFVGVPHDRRAARAGARVLAQRPMPMIRGVTLTTTMKFVKANEEKIRRLIRGLVDAIHFFRARKKETVRILQDHVAPLLGLEDDGEIDALYEEWHRSLEAKPYPSPQAIANVFQLALKLDPEIAAFNPLAMWNTHYVRELDDSGYIDRLYR